MSTRRSCIAARARRRVRRRRWRRCTWLRQPKPAAQARAVVICPPHETSWRWMRCLACGPLGCGAAGSRWTRSTELAPMPTTSQTGASAGPCTFSHSKGVQTNRRTRPGRVRLSDPRQRESYQRGSRRRPPPPPPPPPLRLPPRPPPPPPPPNAATTATEAAAGRLGPRFVDREGAAAELGLVELVDRALGIVVARHLDEREPACASRSHVAHDADGIHGADVPKHLFELGFSRLYGRLPTNSLRPTVLTFRVHDRCTLLPPKGEGLEENSPEWPFHSSFL